jgi:hypothetical protein
MGDIVSGECSMHGSYEIVLHFSLKPLREDAACGRYMQQECAETLFFG